MAYIVSSDYQVTSGTSNTLDVPINQQNDLILVFANVRTSGTLAISGYTGIDSQRSIDSYQTRWFYKIAGAGGESTFTLTSGNAGGIVGIVVVRDAGTSNPIDTTTNIYTSAGAGTTLTSPSPTTTTANCLIVHGVIWDGTTAYVDPDDADYIGGAGGLLHITVQSSAAAIPTFTYRGNKIGRASGRERV